MRPRSRLDTPGAIHHVYLHALDELLLFVDDIDRAAFLALLRVVLRRFHLRCLAWALMGNHVHLLLETGDVPLSAAMHLLARAYAVHYNARHGRRGHVFRSRFGSRLIDSDRYLCKAVTYVLANPVGAPGCRDAAELATYPWTSYAELTAAGADPVVDVAWLLDLFGNSPGEALLALRAALEEECGEDERPDPPDAVYVSQRVAADELLRGVARLDGRREFLDAATRAWEARSARRAVLMSRGWTLAGLVACVCRALRVDSEALRAGRRAARETAARAAIAYIACDLAGEPGAAVARAVGASPAAVTQARRRGRLVLAEHGLSAEFLLGASCDTGGGDGRGRG